MKEYQPGPSVEPIKENRTDSSVAIITLLVKQATGCISCGRLTKNPSGYCDNCL